MADPELAAAHGRNGRKHVCENFPVEKEMSGINAVYDRIWRKSK